MCAYQRILAVMFLFFVGALSGACGFLSDPVAPSEVIPRVSKTLPWWVEIVENNPDCGINALKVSQNVELSGRVGHFGEGRWRQAGCRIHLKEPLSLNQGCDDEMTLSGNFYIAFEKQMSGWLTSDMVHPIVLDAQSQIRYQIHVSNLNVNISSDSESLVLKGESLIFYSEFGVTEEATSGLCEHPATVPSHVDVQVTSLTLEMLSEDDNFRVNGVSANYVFERHQAEPMVLKGYMSTADSSLMFSLPSPLHPWEAAMGQCESTRSITTVPSSCLPRPAKWSQEVVRSSFSLIDSIIDLMERNPQCGFQTPSVVAHSSWSGTVGTREGRVTYDIATPCLIELRENTPVTENCHGEKTFASGGVWVTGQKTTQGWLTGDSERSIVPDRAMGTTYDLHLQFEDFQWQQPGSSTLRIRSGTLQTKVRPKYVLNLENGKCDVRTPEMEMQELQWTDAHFVSNEDEGAFEFNLISATAQGTRGTIGSKTNSLSGTINVMGEVSELPLRQKESYVDLNSLKFRDSYQCKPKVNYRPDALACDYLNVLSATTASLVLDAFAQSNMQMLSDRSECGFASPQVALNPSVQRQDDELLQQYSWEIEDCEQISDASRVQVDCQGLRTASWGRFSYSGTKSEEGRPVHPLEWSGVSPQAFDAMALDVSQVTFDHFDLSYGTAYDEDVIEARGIHLTSGTMAGRYQPIRALNETVAGLYDIDTPIAAFNDIEGNGLALQLRWQGQRFDLQIEELFLTGQKGAFAGTSNEIYGRMKVNGRWIQLNTVFDQNYDQAQFDSSYSCDEALAEVVPKD